MPDLVVSSSLDTSSWLRDATRAANAIPPARIRVIADTKPLGIISGQAAEFNRSLQASSARVLAFSASAGALYGVAKGFTAIFKAMVDVQKQLVDINNVMGLSSKQLSGFSADLFKAANETGQSFKVAAQAALEFSRQGLSMGETLKRTKDALTLTRLSGLDAVASVESLTAAINGFNDVALDSTTIINKLSTTDAAFAVSSKDFAEALQRVGSTAKDTGVQFDSLIGLVTSAQQTTARGGAIIGNALKSIFTRLQRTDTLENLKELGVLVEDVNGEALSSDRILVNLAKTYDTLSSAQKNQVVQLSAGLFQANQFRAILQDLSRQSSIYERATQTSATATDQAARRQAELNKTLASGINTTLNNLTQLAAKIGTLTLEPGLKRVLGGVNFLTGETGKELDSQGETLGSTIGTGMLRGLGNYLSGPGLGLGIALLGKLFVNFASYSVKALGQILEVSSVRYQKEQAIAALLASEPNLYGEINKLSGNQLGIQTLINRTLAERNILLNTQAAAVSAIYAQTGRSIPFVGGTVISKPFALQGEKIAINPRGKAAGLIPSIQESIGALKGGYTPGNIREMNIPKLGQIIYNSAETIKNFPGLGQPAIIPPKTSLAGQNYQKSFQTVHGFNPYSAGGLIPHFAAGGYYQNIPSPFKDPFGRPPAFTNISLQDSLELENRIKEFKEKIKTGIVTQKNFNEQLAELNKGINLTDDSLKEIVNRRLKPSIARTGIGTGELIGPLYPVEERKLQQTQDFEKRVGKLNLAQALFNTPEYRRTKADADKLQQQGVLKARQDQFRNTALTASFVLPLLTGVTQQGAESLFGNQSTLTRGAARAVGGLGNIGSFALTGFGIGGGAGALIGTGLGLLSEIPDTIKAFNDTLPDLQKNLERLKETSQKSSTAISSYIDISEKLFDKENLKGLTRGQVGQLRGLQLQSGTAIPFSEDRRRLRELIQSGNFGGARELQANLEQYFNQQLRGNDLQQQTQGFLKTFKSPGQIEAEAIPKGGLFAGITPSVSQRLQAGITQEQLNNSQRQQDIQLYTSAAVSQAFGLINKEGTSLFDIISKSENVKKFGGKENPIDVLSKLGTENKINPIALLSNIESLRLLFKASPEFEKGIRNALSPSEIQKLIDDAKKFEDASKDYTKSLDSFNQRLVELSSSGRKAVNDFEIGVLQRFSRATTRIDIGNIREKVSNQITLTNAGDNQYLKNFLDLTERQNEAQGRFAKENLGAQGNFSTGVATFLSRGLTEFLAKARDTITERLPASNPKDLQKTIALRENIFKETFKGFANVEGSVFSLGNKKNFDIQDVETIKKNISDQIGRLDKEKLTDAISSNIISAIQALGENPAFKNLRQLQTQPVSLTSPNKNLELFSAVAGIQDKETRDFLLNSDLETLKSRKLSDEQRKIITDNLKSIYVTADELLLNLAKQTAQFVEDLNSTNQKAAAEFRGNKELFSTQFNIQQSGLRYRTGVDIGAIINRGNLGRQSLISTPFQQLNIQQSLANRTIADQFRTSIQATFPGIQLGNINQLGGQINSRKNRLAQLQGTVFGAELEGQKAPDALIKEIEQIQGEIEKLTGFQNEFTEAIKKSNAEFEEQKKNLQLQQNLLENRVSAIREQNRNLAASGTPEDFKNITKNLGNTFSTGLGFNSNDFFNTLSTDVADFSQEFKDAFKGGFEEAIKGSKSFSDAMRDVALNIANNITTKVTNLGIDSILGGLFGNQTIGGGTGLLSGLLGAKKSLGGYIPRLARGGYVDMGSGIRDDVPAFLSGGEFVLNKRAVQSIGKENLDSLNFGSRYKQPRMFYHPKPTDFQAAVLSDSVSISSSSASFKLANALTVDSRGRNAKLNVSPLLSSFALSDPNSRQNQLRFAREQWFLGKAQYDKTVSDAKKKFESNRLNALYISLISAGVTAGSGAIASRGFSSSNPAGLTQAEIDLGNTSPNWNPGQYTTSSYPYARGGYIPRFNMGGYYGGEDSTDRFSAFLTGGEYVASPRTVQKYGVGTFERLNRGYAAGGYVGNYNDTGINDSFDKLIEINTQIRDYLSGNKTNKNIQTNNKTDTTAGITVNFTSNITVQSNGTVASDTTATTTAGQTSTVNKDNLNKMVQLMKAKSLETIREQTKAGGLLNEIYVSKR